MPLVSELTSLLVTFPHRERASPVVRKVGTHVLLVVTRPDGGRLVIRLVKVGLVSKPPRDIEKGLHGRHTNVSPSTSNGLSGSPELVMAEAPAPPKAPVKTCRFVACRGASMAIRNSPWKDASRLADATATTDQAARR